MENKQAILNEFTEVLRMTEKGHDVKNITIKDSLNGNNEVRIIFNASGKTTVISFIVSKDISGIGLIKEVIWNL